MRVVIILAAMAASMVPALAFSPYPLSLGVRTGQPGDASMATSASALPLQGAIGRSLSRGAAPGVGQRRSVLAGLRAVAEGKGVADVGVILLAGGVGSRMKAGMPKQFLELRGKPMLMHSLDLFLTLDGIKSITIVIAPEYRNMFDAVVAKDKRITFADPGKERQDSVFNGLTAMPAGASLVAVHDAARPLVTPDEVYKVFHDADEHGAAVLAVPMKATVKESDDGQFVLRTIERSRLWEIHTPQVIRPELLRKGFEKVAKEGLAVTDDVSIIEQLPAPVKITVGEYTNIKVTTPEDMPMAESILSSRK